MAHRSYPLTYERCAAMIWPRLHGPVLLRVGVGTAAGVAIAFAWVAMTFWLGIAWVLDRVYEEWRWPMLRQFLVRVVERPWLGFAVGACVAAAVGAVVVSRL
jgi:hypothetical protein